jgi:fatty acid desaturase
MPLWYINGKVYDFSTFQHPGGPVTLDLSQGRDATELFKSYHPFSKKPEAFLAKYQVHVDGAKQIPTATFDWEHESLFWKELKDEVHNELGSETKATWFRWIQIWIMAAIALTTIHYFIRGDWWALIACPLAVWLVGVNVFHDASHFALSKKWYINHYACYLFPFFSSPFTWYHQHVIGHHVYTNIHRHDPDMHHGTYLWKYTRQSRFYKHYKWQLYYVLFIWMNLSTSLAFIIDLAFFMQGTYHKTVKMAPITTTRRYIHYIGRIITLYIVFLWPFFAFDSLLKAFVWSILPMYIFGFCFAVSSQFNHITMKNMESSDLSDWYKHQVLTSHTFCPDSLFWFFFTGGLNMQIEHHLFPGVNHWRLRKIQPIVQRVCKKHNVHYHSSDTIGEAIRKHKELLTIMSKNPNFLVEKSS